MFNVVGAAAGYTEAVRLAAIRGAFGVAKTVVSTASSVAHRIVRRNRHGEREMASEAVKEGLRKRATMPLCRTR